MSEKCTVKLTKSEAKRLKFMLNFIGCELASKMAKEDVRKLEDRRNLK